MLHFIATSHALKHAKNNESWHCYCLACRFTKEFKISVQEDDGTIRDVTVAEAVLNSLEEQGYYTQLEEPIVL